MRIVALFLGIAVAGFGAVPATQAQCRCNGCAGAVNTSHPQDRPFWDARSGRYLFLVSRTQAWFYWQPEQKQWVAVPPTPQSPAPAAPAMQTPSRAPVPGESDGHQHSHGTQPAPAAQTQLPYGGQRRCPVMDEELGAHGTPIPVTVRGQTVYVCCRGCVKQLQADPDKYLPKVAAERARSNALPSGR